ncbi:hypothetical protein [Desulfovibrio sp. TomC]|uniref:hypothetical protein n=1 Tax=Desulfovibrio sp. TomC TaxID=1562888 RepID=UPI0005733EF2|nr:hypothetical protein [Desulfovibrio sp. TomC]KHK04017.1 hypothetical protein NY78_0459 [Desulfovibrio sp. TomC]
MAAKDFHKLMQCFLEINAQDISEIWDTIEKNKNTDRPKHDVGAWHSVDGKVFTLETGILNTGGRMLKVAIGPDGKFVTTIIFPDMD